ncbi:MAG: STAS domain-containing protein [Planctomycetota bacterium]|nr:STAS domain-containing protein [Planctomycetota bacterium]
MPIERWSDSIVVVHVADDPQFSEDVAAVQHLTPACSAVLDFATVHYVNSSCIAKLLRLRRHCISQDVRLVICNVNNPVWGTLLMTGLDKIFEVSENVPTALATLQMQEPAKKARN